MTMEKEARKEARKKERQLLVQKTKERLQRNEWWRFLFFEIIVPVVIISIILFLELSLFINFFLL